MSNQLINFCLPRRRKHVCPSRFDDLIKTVERTVDFEGSL